FSILGRSLNARVAMLLGALASAASMVLLSLSLAWHSLPTFLMSTAIGGVGYSLLFVGGLQTISAAAPPERRGGVLSALYLFAYLSLGVVALVLGVIATRRNLKLAVDLGAGSSGLLSAASAGMASLAPLGSQKSSSDSP